MGYLVMRDVTGEPLSWLPVSLWRDDALRKFVLEFLRLEILKFFSEKFDKVFEFFRRSKTVNEQWYYSHQIVGFIMTIHEKSNSTYFTRS